MPLFEVVGVTSTGVTFSAAFMLLASERHHNFVWALEKLKGLFLRFDSYPKVVVSDRDIALTSSIMGTHRRSIILSHLDDIWV